MFNITDYIMKRNIRKRSASVPPLAKAPSGKDELDELDESSSADSSSLCYSCGINWKKKNIKYYNIDHTFDPPRTGKYPIFVDEPKAPKSDSLCSACYHGVRDNFNLMNNCAGNSYDRNSAEREFIGDNSNREWCSRVIVSISLLVSLVAFLMEALIKTGVKVEYDLAFKEGIAILTMNFNDKFYEWTSSTFKVNPGNRHREYSIHLFISNAIYLTGNRITALFRYLDLLGIWHQSKSAVHSRNQRELMPAVEKYFKSMMEKVKSILCVLHKKLFAQEDEQHSRETRKRGQAPFCTAILIETLTRLIMCRSHVQKSDYPGKALANVSQLEVVKALVAMVALTGAIVATFGVDGCTTALGVFTAYIVANWPDAKLGRDNWHKMNDWHNRFEAFCNKNTKAYARDRVCPRISELFNSGKIHLYKIKKHFIFCANECGGSVDRFREMFLGMADYWGDKYGIPEPELVHFRIFLDDLLGKDLHLYVNGTHTSLCESFHSLCNKYCPKAQVRSFDMYCMLKDLAIIHWNERMFVEKCGIPGDPQRFRYDIINSIVRDSEA